MNKIPKLHACRVDNNTMLKIKLKMNLILKKIKFYETMTTEFKNSYTKEDLEDEKVRTIFTTKAFALQYILKKLQTEFVELTNAKSLMYL